MAVVCVGVIAGCAAPASGGTSSGGRSSPAPIGMPSGRPATSALTGELAAVGGPAGTPRRPLSGHVTITEQTTDIRLTVGTAADGRYSVALPPGTYEIVGHSWQYGNGKGLCQAEGPVRLTAYATAHADVYWQEP